MLLARCLCATYLLEGAPNGGFIFFVYGKNGPAFFMVHGFLLYVIKFKMSGKMGSNLAQPVFMFSFYKYFIRNKY